MIGFDRVRPGHPPSFEQIRRIFEGIWSTGVDDLMALQLPRGLARPSDWLQENSGGVVQLYESDPSMPSRRRLSIVVSSPW